MTLENNGNGDELSLSDLIVQIWHARWFVAGITVLTVILMLAGAVYQATYKSEGLFQFGGPIPVEPHESVGIALANFKRYSANYIEPARFEEYIQSAKLVAKPGVQELRKAFNSREGITKWIEPIYPFTKADAKILVEQPKDETNKIIGLKIGATNKDAKTAQQMASLLGRYVIDSILLINYTDSIRGKQSEIASRLLYLDNQIIQSKESLQEYERKRTDLKDIIARYPNSALPSTQQLVTVTPDSARYLSPITQLVTNEVQASDTRERIVKAKREQQQTKLWGEYYVQVTRLLSSTKSGEIVLRGLENVKSQVFKDKDLNDEVVKEIFNIISMENEKAKNVYFERSRFVAGPTLPDHSTLRVTLTLAIGLVVGFFIAVVLVFVRSWWQENRSKIYA